MNWLCWAAIPGPARWEPLVGVAHGSMAGGPPGVQHSDVSPTGREEATEGSDPETSLPGVTVSLSMTPYSACSRPLRPAEAHGVSITTRAEPDVLPAFHSARTPGPEVDRDSDPLDLHGQRARLGRLLGGIAQPAVLGAVLVRSVDHRIGKPEAHVPVVHWHGRPHISHA